MERKTRQKHAVLRAIEQSGRSLHPAEIQSLARRDVPTLNLSTVYRQLKALVDEQRINKVALPGQAARFEALAPSMPLQAQAQSQDHSHHHHFHCQNCKQVFPISGCPGHIDAMAPQGFVVARHDLTLHGRCAHCSLAPAHETRPS